MSNKVAERELAREIVFDNAGQFRTHLYAAERGAAPDATGDELKRARRDFLLG